MTSMTPSIRESFPPLPAILPLWAGDPETQPEFPADESEPETQPDFPVNESEPETQPDFPAA